MSNFTTANDYNSKESSKREFSNNEGIAAWINKSKNANAYFRIELPLGLSSICLFPANDKIEKVFNQFYEEINT